MNSFRLDGRVAIVTGGAQGLGRVLARGLAQAGAAVVVGDIDGAGAEGTATDLVAAGLRAVGLAADITSRASCAGLLARAGEAFGGVHILVNNAAIDVIAPAIAATADDWQRIINVNLTGAFHLSQLAARDMIARRVDGTIINISSIAARVGIPHLAGYAATKAGLEQLTRVLAVEWASHGIRVNAVAPGYLDNVMAGADAVHRDPAMEEAIRRRTPLGRRARLDELVGPVVFLASPAASYVTGAVLLVDGGYSAG